ncbi:hypothetical protein TNCV_675401 [Trichonephila clavipes]|nr:hypothetical protein TNCV_675401 [Trichonephila clavipes]
MNDHGHEPVIDVEWLCPFAGSSPSAAENLLRRTGVHITRRGCAASPFETGFHFRRKTDFFPEEDTTKSYPGFEPEPTRLQAEGHSHLTG